MNVPKPPLDVRDETDSELAGRLFSVLHEENFANDPKSRIARGHHD